MKMGMIGGMVGFVGLLGAFAQPASASPSCLLTDINLTINGTTYNPVSCFTDVQTAANDPATETAKLSTLFGAQTFLAKDDGTKGTLNGIQFALDTPTGNTWTVSWTDVNGAAPNNLPETIDFAVLINGGNNGDAYKFNDVLLPAPPNNSGGGSFTITFLNPGGNTPGLSHMILTGSDDKIVVCPDCVINPTNGVPEPMSLSLLGLGLLGLAAVRKRA